MIKGSEVRKAGHPIEPLLLDRWSPRAMSGEDYIPPLLDNFYGKLQWFAVEPTVVVCVRGMGKTRSHEIFNFAHISHTPCSVRSYGAQTTCLF
jgi:hypothetical protein